MHILRVSHDWAFQIKVIRDATTEDTNLIRFGNLFYRICRPGLGSFSVDLQPSVASRRSVHLTVRVSDLYVTHINGQAFETYAATLDLIRPQGSALDSAVMILAGNAADDDLFRKKSLVVLAVAESLRNDHIATQIGEVLSVATLNLIGPKPQLPIAEMLCDARDWGKTSEAIYQALSPRAREIVLKPRSELTPEDREFSEMVDLSPIAPGRRALARALAVIKRPDSK